MVEELFSIPGLVQPAAVHWTLVVTSDRHVEPAWPRHV